MIWWWPEMSSDRHESCFVGEEGTVLLCLCTRFYAKLKAELPCRIEHWRRSVCDTLDVLLSTVSSPRWWPRGEEMMSSSAHYLDAISILIYAYSIVPLAKFPYFEVEGGLFFISQQLSVSGRRTFTFFFSYFIYVVFRFKRVCHQATWVRLNRLPKTNCFFLSGSIDEANFVFPVFSPVHRCLSVVSQHTFLFSTLLEKSSILDSLLADTPSHMMC